MFVLFGYLGIKGYRWAVITGMILYVLAFIVLAFSDIIAFGFHLYFCGACGAV